MDFINRFPEKPSNHSLSCFLKTAKIGKSLHLAMPTYLGTVIGGAILGHGSGGIVRSRVAKKLATFVLSIFEIA